jgi:murein DD-endopeptidase MepM/ murein hydrolase activator NlpD
VSTAHSYKAAENQAVNVVSRVLSGAWRRVVGSVRVLVQRGNQKFTVMFIPHSERKIFNFQISVFALLFIGALLTAVLVVFFSLSTGFTQRNERYVQTSESLVLTEATVESFGDEVRELERVVTEFRQSLESVLNVVGNEAARGFLAGGVGGDLASFVSESLVLAEDVRSITELRSLRSYLEGAIGPLREIEQVLLAQRELLVDIPTLWPVRAGKGSITNEFGPATHPISGEWYLHQGIDIAWLRGTEILVTANGKVQRVGDDPRNLGIFVVIRHKYGFVTRYGHLSRATVQAGQNVQRGDLLGYMGSTGLSTGPHIHYEVRIAEQLVEPRQFLSISGGSAALSR